MKHAILYLAFSALFALTLYSCCDCPPPKIIPVDATPVTLPEPASNESLLHEVKIMINDKNEISFNDTVYTNLEILEEKMSENFDPEADRFKLFCDKNAKAYSIFDLMKICSENEWKMILATDVE